MTEATDIPADIAYDFALNPRLNVSQSQVGVQLETLLFFDDVLQNAQALIDFAAREVRFAPAWGPGGGYPGIRAPAPLNYVNSLVRALAPVVEKAFNLNDVVLARADCYLSMVTMPRESLAPLQRIPHFDTVDPLQFAFLHYLCDPGFGGTAFFRHRATGLETVTRETEAEFLRSRDLELAAASPEPAYIRSNSPNYEQTAEVEARFNRVLVYRGSLLHSGQIASNMNFSPDPARGRLTANLFVTYRPA
jgi:hypothetical protein